MGQYKCTMTMLSALKSPTACKSQQDGLDFAQDDFGLKNTLYLHISNFNIQAQVVPIVHLAQAQKLQNFWVVVMVECPPILRKSDYGSEYGETNRCKVSEVCNSPDWDALQVLLGILLTPRQVLLSSGWDLATARQCLASVHWDSSDTAAQLCHPADLTTQADPVWADI
ncbi:hypothetical protein DUI87_14093 [Hirundo rustica rustica]|uniref:Uncharacterized protein n=1 Tax=Hirundo rustica rustica TaxID=333673 RepID=A0A3M0KPQ7_HIRRU|nr:hypothetical protein DUI87_14093 [Hirundo rustica rustica]